MMVARWIDGGPRLFQGLVKIRATGVEGIGVGAATTDLEMNGEKNCQVGLGR
jgi:hypothetical protein